MSTKVVSRTSNKAVVQKRVPFREVDAEPVVITGIISGVISVFAVAAPLDLAAGWDLGSSFLASGGIATAITGGLFSFLYASEVASSADNYAPADVPVFKALMGVLFPLGQKSRLGSTRVKLQNKTEHIEELAARHSSTSTEVTHEVNSRIKFTPKGAYIEQEFNASPVALWDDALNTTLEVHKFRKEENKLKSK